MLRAPFQLPEGRKRFQTNIALSDIKPMLWSVQLDSDIASVNAAAQAVGMTAQGLSRWVESGRIKTYGRGPRRAVLVSLREVREAIEWRRRSVSQAEAARQLRVETRRVVELCESRVLPYRQPAGPGGDYEIESEAVAELAAVRRQEVRQYVSIKAAVLLTGWPRWVLNDFIAGGRLVTRPGARGALLLDRKELESLVEEMKDNPPLCPVCQLPLAPGRAVHKGRCAGMYAIAQRHAPGAQQSINRRKRDELGRLKRREGLRTVPELAKDLQRSTRVVWRYIWRLDVGTFYPGPGGRITLLTGDEAKTVADAISAAQLASHHADPRWRSEWYRKRFDSWAEYGRQASALAAERGKRVGQRITDEKRERIIKLAEKRVDHLGERYSEQRIANTVGVSRATVRYVLKQHRRKTSG